jgi:tetratricopeptide (TPR) repeat protein
VLPALCFADSDLTYIKARQKFLDGKYEEAAKLFEKSLKDEPQNPYVNHQLAEVYLRLGNYDRAEELCKVAVEKEPNNVEYRITYGGILASLKKYDIAKAQYVKITELEPENPRAPLLIGILEAEGGQLEKGVATLGKIIEKSPDNYTALFYRAKIYIEMDQIKKAKTDLEKCLVIRPNFTEAATILGMIYEKNQEIDQAIDVYKNIQSSGKFKKRLAQLYLQKNEFEKALEELIEYEKLEPDDYTARVKIGLIYFELKQYEKAKERFLVILKEQPTADNVRFYLAAIYEELKQYDQAIIEFKKVTKDSAFYKESILHTGFLLKDQGRIKEGIEFSKKVLLKHNDISDFYDMHAAFYESNNQFDKAMQVVEDGLKKFPEEEKLLYFQGALFDKIGQRRRGIENMKRILDANPQNAHALNFLAYTYAEINEHLDEAEKLIQKAQVIRPNDGYIEDTYGWVLFRKGKVEQAIAKLKSAAEILPTEAVIFEHLGDIYNHKKDTLKAEEYYRKAINLNGKKNKEAAKKVEQKLAAIKDSCKPTNQ